MKKLLLFVVVLGAAGLAVVYVSLGSIIKKSVETYGPKMAGAPVSVTLVTVSPFTGEGTVRGLVIGNPPGFTTKNAVEVGSIKVGVDVRSLLGSGRIIIREILVDEPKITLETGKGGTNLQAIQRNLDAYAPSSPKEAEKTQARKIEIGRFRLRGAEALAVVPQLKSAPKSVKVPDIEITGIGSKSGGVTPSEAAKLIIGELGRAALRAAGGLESILEHGVRAFGGDDAAKKLESLKNLFKK